MSSKLDFEFERSLRTTSELGVTIYWLKATYGYQLEEVVTNATQLLYWPLVLVDAQEAVEEIVFWVTYARQVFQERMELTHNAPPLEAAIPKRVKFKFQQSFERSSREGKTFAWLVDHYRDRAADVVLDAICMLYGPAALVAIPAARDSSQRRAYCSRLAFEELMTRPMLQTKSSLELLRVLSAATGNQGLPGHDGAEHRVPEARPIAAPEPERVEDVDEEDDFIPPVYDLNFGN